MALAADVLALGLRATHSSGQGEQRSLTLFLLENSRQHRFAMRSPETRLLPRVGAKQPPNYCSLGFRAQVEWHFCLFFLCCLSHLPTS